MMSLGTHKFFFSALSTRLTKLLTSKMVHCVTTAFEAAPGCVLSRKSIGDRKDSVLRLELPEPRV